eukprot:Gregarina_sp_Pseudo_9__884@NODE_1564_length_1491_cov_4_154959_g1451_i0_p1_GENE_NODE_1564_length_1491_cov_4_154959_g1451_i0NODE_1564_length_1491_cov_4_154959_g1451_i0_p1_ORF_typecomplete_len248_score62_28_NODE_1564_length_1491_cov_4_154959_g1451_i06331376
MSSFAEAKDLIKQLHEVISTRDSRCTSEEQMALKEIRKSEEGWLKPFEFQLSMQPLNFLNWVSEVHVMMGFNCVSWQMAGAPTIAMLLWFCLYTEEAIPGGDEFMALVIEKTWKFVEFWSATVNKLLYDCCPPEERYEKKHPPVNAGRQRRRRAQKFKTLDDAIGTSNPPGRYRGSIAESLAYSNRSSTASTAASVSSAYEAKLRERVRRLKQEALGGGGPPAVQMMSSQESYDYHFPAPQPAVAAK